jgi:hypothetical protein
MAWPVRCLPAQAAARCPHPAAIRTACVGTDGRSGRDATLASRESWMTGNDLTFAIPTYRLRDVGETVSAYDHHFHRNGHTLPIIVFDDSSPAAHEKYFGALQRLSTRNMLNYVGPCEKEQFVSFLSQRLRDRKLDPLIRNLFRPSYGGNRNFTLIYTLGGKLVSADDDMRPYALMEDSPESLSEGEISRGRLIKASERCYTSKSFDMITPFVDVLGRRVDEVPANYIRGELIRDTAMELETNATTGYARSHALLLQAGALPGDAVVKMAQTFRSGTSDIDAIDFVDMFIDDQDQQLIDELGELYILDNFRPAVTKKNWRMDCGVAGYDNTFGLPPFFPTRLRFEDYIYRLWIQQDGIASAHVDSAQHHGKSSYMRNPPAAEVFNEELANLLKRKIKSSLSATSALGIAFDYQGEVTAQDCDEILGKIAALQARALAAAAAAASAERSASLSLFAANLEKTFYGFEPDFFQQNLLRIVDDVITVIKGSLELWPTLIEICYFQKARHGLPMRLLRDARN